VIVACCQLDAAWEDKAASFARARALLAAARLPAGALVLLPELFATGFSMNVDAIAEPEDGPTVAFLKGVASDFGVAVLGGVVRRGPDGRGRNRAVAVSPAGDVLADYAKIHPFTFGEEAKHYRGGDAVATFPWADTTVAPAICYDLRFPELFRAAVGQGAQVLAVIANWPAVRQAHWTALLAARAIENQCYVVGCNRAGDDPANHYAGGSIVIDPRGNVVAGAGAAPCVLQAALDLPALRAYRQNFPALADIRRDLFA
jgi:predicted amidohydrolase